MANDVPNRRAIRVRAGGKASVPMPISTENTQTTAVAGSTTIRDRDPGEAEPNHSAAGITCQQTLLVQLHDGVVRRHRGHRVEGQRIAECEHVAGLRGGDGEILQTMRQGDPVLVARVQLKPTHPGPRRRTRAPLIQPGLR